MADDEERRVEDEGRRAERETGGQRQGTEAGNGGQDRG
jgi:hypothetical protein